MDILLRGYSNTTVAPFAVVVANGQNSSLSPALSPPTSSSSSLDGGGSSFVDQMRTIITIAHVIVMVLGTANLLVVAVILLRSYMRSITNVYMLSLCLADFIYVANLVSVVASQMNNKSWPFGSFFCTMYHGTETTGKFASVIFVVILAADRYCAMCQSGWCSRYRNYRTATIVSVAGWAIAILAASPMYWFSKVHVRSFQLPSGQDFELRRCAAAWPTIEAARWYIILSSILIFVVPLALIIFCYYHIYFRLRDAIKSCRRIKRNATSQAPYHRVTRMVLMVVLLHGVCWTPFWFFNLYITIIGPVAREISSIDRIILNILHLLPYINCALNPLLYAINAENFRHALRSIFCHHKTRESFEDSRLMTLPGINGLSGSHLRTAGVKAGLDGAVLPRALSKNRTSNTFTYPRVSSGANSSNHTTSMERLLANGGACPGTPALDPSEQPHQPRHKVHGGRSHHLCRSGSQSDKSLSSKHSINSIFIAASAAGQSSNGSLKKKLLLRNECETCDTIVTRDGPSTTTTNKNDAARKKSSVVLVTSSENHTGAGSGCVVESEFRRNHVPPWLNVLNGHQQQKQNPSPPLSSRKKSSSISNGGGNLVGSANNSESDVII